MEADYLREQESESAGARGFSQLEDKVMKTAAQFFGKDLLPYVGIKGRIACVAPTEHVHLEMRRLEEDFNFIMKDGSWRHLEFESDSIQEKDLRRFREYEAYIGLTYDVPVTTTVICTSRVKILKKELVNGMNVYRVEVVRLKDRNADKVFEKLQRKISRGKTLGRHDVFPLLLTPLMSGKMEMSQRIYQGMEFLQCKELKAGDEDRKRMQSVLYALAVKFLDRDELAMIKERIGMTVLGKMLFEDGVEKGIEKGIEKGVQQGLGRANALNVKLADAGRADDIIRAASDRTYQEQLFKEFGI